MMNDSEGQKIGISAAQWFVILLVVALTTGAVMYRLLKHERLGNSSAMFLGIPAVLAILLALAPRAKTVTGAILKGITLFLLIIAPLLGEGYLCILIAAPLFYVVGACVGVIIDYSRHGRSTTLSCVTLFLLPLCMEGVVPKLTFNRAQSVQAIAGAALRIPGIWRLVQLLMDASGLGPRLIGDGHCEAR